MGCAKALTLSGGCALEGCLTEPRVSLGTEILNNLQDGIAYAPELCYACFATQNSPAFTECYFNKYEPSTNSFTRKATIPVGFLSSNVVWHPGIQKFVTCAGDTVYMFDPLTNVVTSFSTGIIQLFYMIYVPSKDKIYGEFGQDGTGQTYIGYIDFDISSIIQLGVIPGGPRPYTLIYVPSVDSLFGCWITGLGGGMSKFNLTTNLGDGNIVPGGIEGVAITLDTTRNLIIVHFSHWSEIDPSTGLITNTGPITPGTGGLCEYTTFYHAASHMIYGCGVNNSDFYLSVNGFNCDTKVSSIVKAGNPDGYDGMVHIGASGSVIASDTLIDSGGENGIRRLCLF